MRLRSSEWALIAYFAYTFLLAAIRIPASAWKAALVLALVTALLAMLARSASVARDLAPVLFTLAAFRQMDWFAPVLQDHHLERVWIVWDRALLDHYHLRAAIESLGLAGPAYLELCYLLVYGAAPIAVAILFRQGARARVDTWWLAYLAGTLGAYALFPYFPSDPPRTVFPGADGPHVTTFLRSLNLWIVGNYGIHTSVFPSAHVSSVFSAAWGLLAALPSRRRFGLGMAIYGASVAIATIYGRYHYAADVAAGLAASGLAVVALLAARRK
jgi:membrane-associated phospholipid phosphatase